MYIICPYLGVKYTKWADDPFSFYLHTQSLYCY
nr:MAG TPA: hypothetical protein [Caudoviricetes sp.]